MEYIEGLLILFGGIGTLLVGMAMLSDNMKKLANTKLEAIFNKTSEKKLVGLTIGAGTTAIVQSSSLTSVMIVGLVNAGMITLLQATTMIMGANIGTTITGHIASLQSFDFIVFAMLTVFIGSFMTLLSSKEKIRTIGKVLCGFGLVFVGLHLLGSAMSSFKDDPLITNMLSSISNPFLLLLIGAGLTALFQSSSAITSIVISLAVAGIMIGNGGNDVLFVILGSNIGTCVTAMLSSVGANTNARRAAVIHLTFNILGTVIFAAVLLLWTGFKNDVLGRFFALEATQIAIFHTLFNVICAVLFLPFSQQFVNLSMKLVPDKDDKSKRIVVLDERLLATPSLALHQLRKETIEMANLAIESLNEAYDAFIHKNINQKEMVKTNIGEINSLNKQIVNYLIKLSGEELNAEEKEEISTLYSVINDLERIGDLSDNLSKYTDTYVTERLTFSDDAKGDLNHMMDRVNALFKVSMKAFETNSESDIHLVDEIEDEVDTLRKEIIDSHIQRLNEGLCSANNSPVLVNLVSNLERAADHMTFIAHSRNIVTN
ncbi:MAG: Na/Pi cotransporter family protein [Acholeplasmataceae bacterium]|mgnify:CR=1 FL=1|nr:Na/Pi cotransporter family protein [Acholeplasmataceae bacterium]